MENTNLRFILRSFHCPFCSASSSLRSQQWSVSEGFCKAYFISSVSLSAVAATAFRITAHRTVKKSKSLYVGFLYMFLLALHLCYFHAPYFWQEFENIWESQAATLSVQIVSYSTNSWWSHFLRGNAAKDWGARDTNFCTRSKITMDSCSVVKSGR